MLVYKWDPLWLWGQEAIWQVDPPLLGKWKDNFSVRTLPDIFIPGSLPLLHSVILQHIACCSNLEQAPTSKFNLENLKNRLNISWQIKHFQIMLLARWFLLKMENVNILQEGGLSSWQICFKVHWKEILKKNPSQKQQNQFYSRKWKYQSDLTTESYMIFYLTKK